MKKNIFLISLLSAFVFVGCTGFEKDPFKDKIEAIKNAVPPTTKVTGEAAMSPGAARIIVVNRSSDAFEEGKQTTLTLSVQLFLEGYKYELSIKNMADFPGANFNASTGIFSWTPPAGIVTNASSVQHFVLKAEVSATPIAGTGDDTKLIHEEPFDLFVANSQQRPTVKNVVSSNGPFNKFFEEGSYKYLTVTVEDLDSGGIDAPTLVFRGRTGVKSLAEYTTVSGAPRYVPSTGLWQFEVIINLMGSNIDLTKSADDASLVISAQSKAGLSSLPFTSIDYTVLMRFGGAVSTLSPLGTEFKANVLNTIPFIISDSSNEAVLTVGNALYLPTGAQIKCESSLRPFQLCVFTWTPTSMDIGRSYTAVLPVEMKNPNTIVSDLRVSRSNISVLIKVVP